MSKHAFENKFRSPVELWVGLVSLGFGLVFYLDGEAIGILCGHLVSVPFALLGMIRLVQGLKLIKFHRQLVDLKSFSMSTRDVPISKKRLYIGRGFAWQPVHRQRLHLLSLLENQKFTQKGGLYRFVSERAEGGSKLFKMAQKLPWLKPLPPIGGKPYMHGVGADDEKNIFLPQGNRNSHDITFGMTRVGKTRFMSIKINQDIRNGDALLIIDPKGDLEVMQDIYCAAKACGRISDLKMIHFAYPDLSSKYNPLGQFSNVSEVASRVVAGIASSGQGQTFKDFAWQYVNIVATCLNQLDEDINYKTISFYIKKPELLLIKYVEAEIPKMEPSFHEEIQHIIDDFESKTDKHGNTREMDRSTAIKKWISKFIEAEVSKNSNQILDSIIVPLFNASSLDKSYYDKITASVGPVLDKINQTKASSIFSFSKDLEEITLESIIKTKKIVYIGLDSLTNSAMADSVGLAIIADLVSLCGRIYNSSKTGEANAELCLHIDEFSNVVDVPMINLLNKAGGAGVKISAYTQTVNDLGASMGSPDETKMLIGNFGTINCLRVANEDTAKIVVDCLQKIRARSSTPSTMSNDKSDKNTELFSTYNTDQVGETVSELITINDLYSLPKGQAFTMTNGGELYKIRIPLPKNDGTAPSSFTSLLEELKK